MKFTACLLIAATSAVPLHQTQLVQTKSKWGGFSFFDDFTEDIVETVTESVEEN